MQLRPASGKARPQRASRLIPIAQRREMVRRDPGQSQRVWVPLAAMDIEQAGARGDRVADADVAVELLVEVFGQRDPACGATDSGAAGGAQPAELGGPVAGVKEAPRPCVVGPLIELRAHAAGFLRAPRIGPGEELGGRSTCAV